MVMGISKSSRSKSVIYSLYLLQYMLLNLIMVISVNMWIGKLVTSRDGNQPSIFILGSVWDLLRTLLSSVQILDLILLYRFMFFPLHIDWVSVPDDLLH